jgi:predicted Zn-dependent protease
MNNFTVNRFALCKRFQLTPKDHEDKMNKQIILIAIAAFAGSAAVATGQCISSNVGRITPAEQASLDKAYGLENAAAAAYDAGQYKLAESDARQSLSVGDGVGFSEDILAKTLMAEGKNNEAFKTYKDMVVNEKSSDPDYVLPYALMLLKKGNWNQALDAYNLTLPLVGSAFVSCDGISLLAEDSAFSYEDPEPKDLETDIHIAMGLSKVYSGSIVHGHFYPEKDLAEFKKALDLEPDSPLAILGYAVGLQEVGRTGEATQAYEDIVKRFPGQVANAAQENLKWLAGLRKP